MVGNKRAARERQAALKLELGDMSSKNNRETRFMTRVRKEAADRRRNTRTGEVHLTLTGLKNTRKMKRKSRIQSARTTDR